jgi:mycothiol synthase
MSPLRPLSGRPAHPLIANDFEHQLEMVRPSSDLVLMPPIPNGYELRQFRPKDEGPYEDLFNLAFEDEGRLVETLERALPGGFFVVEHRASGHLVASCVALQGSSSPRHPGAGQLGWLVTDPSHARRGLGTAIAASVTNLLATQGYRCPFLGTEDFRVAAISIYLKLGWRPFIYRDEMRDRWRLVFARIGQAAELYEST